MCFTAAWKIIKAWLPAGAVKKIKFVNKNTVDEYVKPDQKLSAWGGEDSWEYEFVEEEIKAELEPADKIEMNGNEASTSEEEEVKPKNVDESPDSNSYVHVSATSTKTLIESEHRVSLNTQANVTYSAEKDKGGYYFFFFTLSVLSTCNKM